VARRRGGAQLGFGRLDATEEFFSERVVGLGDLFDHQVAPLVVVGFFAFGDRLFDDGLSLVFFILDLVVVGDAAHEVDRAFEIALLSDRDLDGDRGGAEALEDAVEAELEARADLIHLVDEAEAGDVVLGGLSPDGFGLGFDAFLAVEDGDGAVEDAQGALDFDGEVDVTGGVDEVDVVYLAVARPEAARGGGLNGDAAFLFLLHGVHDGGAFVDLTHLVDLAGVEEDALGDGGLAGVNVGGDADIADFGEVAGHGFLFDSCCGCQL